MPTRRLPKTDDERSSALSTCNTKFQNTAPALRLISDDQFAALGATLSPWRSAREAAGPLLVAQSTATSNCERSFSKCVKNVSHFIQVVNLAIEREVLVPGVRGYYQLPTGHAEVPEMNTSPDALQWAAKLETGENQRLTAGGQPMAWPSIGEVNAAAADLESCENIQSAAKDAYDFAQEAVANQRDSVDLVIKDLWDTIEYRLRTEEPASLRRKAREWGVVYEGDEEGEPTPPPPTAPEP